MLRKELYFRILLGCSSLWFFIPRGVQGDTSIVSRKGGGESIGPSGRPRTLGGLQERWRLPSVESSEFFPPFFTAAKKHTREFYCVSCQVSRRWLAFCSKGWKCKANKSGEESLSSRYGFAKKRSKGSFDILLMEKTPAPLGIF